MCRWISMKVSVTTRTAPAERKNQSASEKVCFLLPSLRPQLMRRIPPVTRSKKGTIAGRLLSYSCASLAHSWSGCFKFLADTRAKALYSEIKCARCKPFLIHAQTGNQRAFNDARACSLALRTLIQFRGYYTELRELLASIPISTYR